MFSRAIQLGLPPEHVRPTPRLARAVSLAAQAGTFVIGGIAILAVVVTGRLWNYSVEWHAAINALTTAATGTMLPLMGVTIWVEAAYPDTSAVREVTHVG